MSDDDSAWQVEAACHAAWPTAAERLIDGWLVRAGGGATWRLNAIHPTREGPRDPAALLAGATLPYAAMGRPVIARVPAMATGLDAALDRLGFGPPAKRTLTLLGRCPPGGSAEVALAAQASAAWIAGRIALAGLDGEAARQLRATLALIGAPTAFAMVERNGAAAAVGYAALIDGLLVLEAIATAVGHRREGLGRALVAALIGWGATHGAAAACLQVQADNAPALALYRRLGLVRALYPYHYRVMQAG